MASAATVGILRAMLTMDTANFDQGARKAGGSTKKLEKELGGLTTQVSKLTPQAERMVKAFGGDRLLHQANNLTAAVNKLGGAQKLTAVEQAKVNRTLNDALAKYQALGQQAPAEMLKLQKATSVTSQGTGVLSAKMVGLGAAAGTMAAQLAGSALRAVVNMGKEAFESAGTIVDLSNSTGLTTKTIQQMQFVAEQTGSSLESFTGAAFKLGTRLAGGGDSVKQAVSELGLEFEKLQAMRPDEQWNVVAAALGKVQDAGERNRLGVILMGKTFADVSASITENYTDLADQATLSSDAQIQALNRAGDAWDKYKARQKATVRSILGDFVVIAEEAKKSGFLETLSLLLAFPTGLGSNLDGGANAIVSAFARSVNGRRETDIRLPAANAMKSYQEQLAGVRAELEKLTPAQRAEIEAAKELGVNVSDLEDKFGLSVGALSVYNTALKDTAKDSKAAGKSQAELAKDVDKAAASYRAFRNMIGEREFEDIERAQAAFKADVLTDIGHQMAGIESVVDASLEARDKLDERDAKWRAHRNEIGERILEDEGAMIARSEERWRQYYQTVANVFIGLVDVASSNLGTLIFGSGGDNGAKQAAEEAAESYERLKASGVASAEAITQAFQDMRRAQAQAQDSFADRLRSVWDGIRRYLIDVLNQILNYFVHSFLEGMIKAIVGSKLSQTLGQAIVGGVGGATGGIGGIAQVAGGAILPSVLGTGGAAAGGVLASSSIAGASAATIPALASAGVSAGGAVSGGGAGMAAAVGGGIGTGALIGLTAGIGGAAVLLAWGIKSKGWFRGGEEGVKVNPRRGRFVQQFGPPGTGEGSGFHNLAVILHSITKKSGGGPLMDALNAADTVKEFEAAQANILALLARNGRPAKAFNMGGFVPPGAVVPAVLHGGRFGEVIAPLKAPASGTQPPRVVHHHAWHITAWDATDVRRGMKQIIKELKFEAQTNENGLVPAFSRAQGLA